MDNEAKIYVSGHTGLLGRALLRMLSRGGYKNIITKTSEELDLRSQAGVRDFFQVEKPDYVFHLAARVGGMKANMTRSAEFIFDNLVMQNNVIHEAHLSGVKRLLFTGSNCMYPRACAQPMKEDYLFTGELEPTNEAYAVAKLAGLSLCQNYNKQYGTNFVVAIPASFYGPNDHFGDDHSHMVPQFIILLHDAKLKKIPAVDIPIHPDKVREFIYVDEVASACLFLIGIPVKELEVGKYVFNIGSGRGIRIGDFADIVKKVVGYDGKLNWEKRSLLGMPEKVLDSTKISEVGWTSKMSLEDGITATYRWFLENQAS